MNVTLSTNTASRGKIARFSAFLTFGEFSAVEDSSSFDESSMINAMATRAPPTPAAIGVDMAMALEVAADDDTVLNSIFASPDLSKIMFDDIYKIDLVFFFI